MQTALEETGRRELLYGRRAGKMEQESEGGGVRRGGWLGERRRGVPLGARRYISSPLSGTRQKGCGAETDGGKRRR